LRRLTKVLGSFSLLQVIGGQMLKRAVDYCGSIKP